MDWNRFQNQICSLDLEADDHGEIFAIGAVYQDREFQKQSPFNIRQVLQEFDVFAKDAGYLLGHNILLYDLPLCHAVDPKLSIFNKPVIDTLILSPLAFPENPYHRLVKNYKLVRDSMNDPLADARLALSLFKDQWQEFREQQTKAGLLTFYRFTFSDRPDFAGIQQALSDMGAERLEENEAHRLFVELTRGAVCYTAVTKTIPPYLTDTKLLPALAYCLAWLRVAGGNSVIPPWVREQFHEVAPVLRQLRDIPCQSPDCRYCRQTHDPLGQLQRYFGFSAYRAQPENDEGGSLQQDIVQAAMSDTPMFAVLPTGGGKSLCYQLPALVRYQRRGVLTIVISPLQALMKDQVDNLRNKTGAPSTAALNGLLTAPERGEVLKSIQMGDIALLYVSPEQLRNAGFKKAIEHREIGCWVFDEAHCLSKWGHDFRPDYLYVARFIKEFAQKQHALLPPVQCFTATAKQDVKNEIVDYFKANLAQELKIFEGGVEHSNLQFEVQTVSCVDKYPRILHLHVMNEYARQGLEKIGHALAFVVAYFSQDKTDFVKRYFKGRKEILERATSQQSFQRIVSDLQNPEQQSLVASHEDDNLLILAGPGSGKTRVVIHRCAYLIRVKQVPASSILILCFNRNAVTELRKRLFDLVGPDAKSVTIQTYHGISLLLSGHAVTSGAGAGDISAESQPFQDIIRQAIDLLTGKKDCLTIEGDEMRNRLIAGYRFILVDEYQDIDEMQYQLISAITGRNQDEDSKLTILAVGDDDQNIYQFRGANVGFIRRFEQDYQASKHFLVENYRSSANIIASANQLIQANRDRMKKKHPIRINGGRKGLAPGGRWEKLDPLARGRVQILVGNNEIQQAQLLVQELLRLRQLDNSLEWPQCAVLATGWRLLNPVRGHLEAQGVPLSVVLPSQIQPSPFRIRENLDLIHAVEQCEKPLCKASVWLDYMQNHYGDEQNYWSRQLVQLLLNWEKETGDADVGKFLLVEYIYESLGELRRECRLGKGVFLGTIHSVKGMEFSHVCILDGGWSETAREEQRRLYYVAMTRAKETLCLLKRTDLKNPFLRLKTGDHLMQREFTKDQTGWKPIQNKHYSFLGLQDLDLSYAGSFAEEHGIHQTLGELAADSTVTMDNHNGRVVLKKNNMIVAVLSKKANTLWLNRVEHVESTTIIAMITRYKSDSEEQFQSRCKVEQWEVPMVEVVYLN